MQNCVIFTFFLSKYYQNLMMKIIKQNTITSKVTSVKFCGKLWPREGIVDEYLVL